MKRDKGYYWISRCTQEHVREVGWWNGKKWVLMNSSGLWNERDVRSVNEQQIIEDANNKRK